MGDLPPGHSSPQLRASPSAPGALKAAGRATSPSSSPGFYGDVALSCAQQVWVYFPADKAACADTLQPGQQVRVGAIELEWLWVEGFSCWIWQGMELAHGIRFGLFVAAVWCPEAGGMHREINVNSPVPAQGPQCRELRDSQFRLGWNAVQTWEGKRAREGCWEQ